MPDLYSWKYEMLGIPPELISRSVTQLSPQQQHDALRNYAEIMANEDFTMASEWLNEIDVAEETHGEPLSHAG